MKNIKLKYDGEVLTRTDTEKLHQHMIDEVIITLETNLTDKFMIMFLNGDDKTILPLKHNKCIIPTILLNKEYFYVKLLYGENQTNYVLIPLSEITPPTPPEPSPVPPDIFQIIFDKLGTKFDDVLISDSWLIFYSEDVEVARIKINDEEVDPIYSSSPAHDISYNDIEAWDNKKDSSELDEEYLNLQNYMCS